ncbi:hypothetical protein FUAX_50520 (plasmid) [Fulvitalea axinellae]|uniref:Carrier domain-containing protein n=1 Tax=Fulvitalea axinellae TaxID=1182444 RepID=A0AAU9CTU1_9BACT|nr:hypothetical protein FUAX_50520 [Fulvitalea axinellae]
MKKDVVKVSFSELRSAYEEVISFVSYYSCMDVPHTQETRLEKDLCFSGLDSFSLLEMFSKKFNVSFDGVDLDKYLMPEFGGSRGCFRLLLFPVFLPYAIVKYIIGLFVSLFSEKLSTHIRLYDIPIFRIADRKDISLGDLTTSVLLKKFTERENIVFVIG